MITRKDIAIAAGVSMATVTRVVSGKGYVSKKNREKVMAAVNELNYFPSVVAQNFTKGYSNILAVLVEDLKNQYFYDIFLGMNEEAEKLGLMVSLFAVNESTINDVVKKLISNRVRGIVNLSLWAYDKNYVDVLNNMGCFITSPDGKSPFILNYETGMRQVFEHLALKNKKKMAFFAGMSEELICKDNRYLAYKKLVGEFGFLSDENFMVYGNYPYEDAFSVGYSCAKRFIESGITVDSVFCLNDVLAMGVLKALKELKVKVPEEISVIGCDDIAVSAYMSPSLTSIKLDKRKEGQLYVQNIDNGKIEKGKYVFDTQLVCRESMV